MTEAEKRLLTGSIKFYTSMIGALCKAIHEKHGDQDLEAIRSIAWQYGSILGKNLKKQAGSLKAAGDIQQEIVKSFGWKQTWVSDDNQIRIVANECPYDIANTSRDLCYAIMELDRAIWYHIDPKLKFHIDETMATGSPQCVCRVVED